MSFESAGEKFERLVAIMARLRAPDGCPWDREQSFDSIKPYLLEETYEVMEAIDARDWPELAEELGDLMLQSVFFAQMASEEGKFRIEDEIEKTAGLFPHRAVFRQVPPRLPHQPDRRHGGVATVKDIEKGLVHRWPVEMGYLV